MSARIGDLTREAVRTSAGTSLLIVPLGSTEQHGLHLPAATDSVIVEAVAERAAELVATRSKVLLAPTLAYGCSHHHLAYPGVGTLSHLTYITTVVEICESLLRSGFKRLLLLNGHGGNEDALRVAARTLVHERKSTAVVGVASYWSASEDALAEIGLPSTWRVPGHAGGFETSLMLAIRPDLVDLERRPSPSSDEGRPIYDSPNGLQVHASGAWEARNGYTDTGQGADPDIGERMLRILAERVAGFLGALAS